MALVHSRVRRVIFGVPNRSFGGLGGRLAVHQASAMNHHYIVLHATGELLDRCQSLAPAAPQPPAPS